MSETADISKRAEEARARPAAHGPDLDLSEYSVPVGRERAKLSSLRSLGRHLQQAAARAGIETSETGRSASFLQVDYSVLYERIRRAHQGQLELLSISEALERHSWLRDYRWKAVAVDLDKYTAQAELFPTGGFFLRVLPHRKLAAPVQACLLVQENDISQNVHNVIVMEEQSEAKLITGCTLSPGVATGLHIGVTEVFLKRGASLADTMVHNWSEGFHVRSRTGVLAESDASYASNYILLEAVRSVQTYSNVVLRGENARAQFNSILFGRKGSRIDVSVRAELLGRGTQAESISRAVGGDEAELVLRGELAAAHDESRGHLDCRGMLLSERARIHAVPELVASARNAELSHEAAVGPISEEVVEYLMSRGIPREEAVSILIRGFLNVDLPGLPDVVTRSIREVLKATAEHMM